MGQMFKDFLYGFVMFFILSFLVFGLVGCDSKQELKKEVTTDKNTTLADYRLFEKEDRLKVVSKTIELKGWDKNLTAKYIDCMGDYAFNKNQELKYNEVMGWCRDEKERKPKKFNNHFNELDAEDLSVMAYVMCKAVVKSRLKSPASADFPFLDRKSYYRGKHKYIIKSYVDSQNSFGANIRTNYHCKMNYTKGEPADIRNWKYEVSFY